MKQRFTTVVNSDVAPPDIDLFDMTERDLAQNEAYCRELEAKMLAAELDPNNFFRRKGTKSRYNIGQRALI